MITRPVQRPRTTSPRRRSARAIIASVVTGVLAVASLVAIDATAASAADACTTGGNAIVCENAKPGTSPSIWDVDGAGATTIQGYSTDVSVNVGSKIDFKISTTARAYSIDIYRTGWYQGLGARKVASVSPSATLPQSQPTCVSDAPTANYDCGNWAVSASWNVPTDAVSGVYFALLTRTDTGADSHIVFVVRDRASTSDILFQTSDPTWQAYNTYGGSDFYQGAARGRAYKISYNRPVVTRGNDLGRDFYFSSEYAQVRFLERNGYDVSYFSGVDTDRFGTDLTKHKVFMSVGHDEYWSTGQRANVEAARDAGVNMQFLSGNEAYWHTRYENSIAGTATPYRTLVDYKDTWSDQKLDTSNATWTGTWRDPRFASQANGAGLPENALTGTMYMANASDLPITVSAAEGKTRLWRNTSLASLAAGTKQALAAHTIGYESDEDVDNGFRPSGLIRLSTTTGAVDEYLQDFGKTVAKGTTTHNVTLYRASSGALVFSAGTIQWAWGLDSTHDGQGAAADIRMQQAQVNLNADMGAFPKSLMSGLVAPTASTDTVPPTVSISSPAAGSTIANGSTVTVSGTAADADGVVAGIQISTDAGATWHTASGTTSWSYTFVQHGSGTQAIRVRAVDDSANYAPTAPSVAYTVSGPYSVFGAEAPRAADSGDTSAVELGLKFSPVSDGYVVGVRFFKSAANTGTHTGSVWNSNGVRLGTATFANETASGWQTVTFASPVAVTAGSTYTVSYNAPKGHYSAMSNYWAYPLPPQEPLSVTSGYGAVPAGVYSTDGSAPSSTFGGANYYVDALFSSSDTSAVSASSQWPLPDSSSVALDTKVSAVLSKAVDASSVGIRLVDQNGQAVSGSTAYVASTRTATFTPAAPLNGFVVYTATISATTTGGATVTSGATWSFTTVRPAATVGVCPCSLYDDSATPATLDSADAKAVTLGVKFTPTKDGSITGAKFYKAPANTGTHTATLWSPSGASLATAVFSGESSAGWQAVSFSSPVAVTANSTYTVSYRTTVGRYSVTSNAYASAATRGPLTTPAKAGVYSYSDVRPTTAVATSYFVDPVFTTTAPAFGVAAQNPSAGSTAVARGTNVTLQLNAPVADGYSVSVGSGGVAVTGVTTLSTDRTTITFDPTADLPNNARVDVSFSGLASQSGATLAAQNWSFTTADTTAAPATTYTLFGTETPSVAADPGDSASVELGVSFTPSAAGSVTGIRFYKGSGNTGTHVGSLWNSTGQRMANVTFTNETASGWQTATLATPVALTAGQKYVVSYLAPAGHYASTSNYFTKAKTSGPLTAGTTKNGLYLYGAGGAVPTYSYAASNYFVDVVYSVPAATTPPTTAPPTTTPPSTAASESIFADSSVPANAAWDDSDEVQVGVRFTASVAGTVSAVRFYKGPGNDGVHQVYLWAADGTQLGTATATGETASGWQTVAFSAPIPVTAGAVYRASYIAPAGHYALDANGLSSPVVNGSLSTVANGGVYTYGSGAPDSTAPHNYWVDVKFTKN